MQNKWHVNRNGYEIQLDSFKHLETTKKITVRFNNPNGIGYFTPDTTHTFVAKVANSTGLVGNDYPVEIQGNQFSLSSASLVDLGPDDYYFEIWETYTDVDGKEQTSIFPSPGYRVGFEIIENIGDKTGQLLKQINFTDFVKDVATHASVNLTISRVTMTTPGTEPTVKKTATEHGVDFALTIPQAESSYQAWLSEGNSGSKQDFLNSLKVAADLPNLAIDPTTRKITIGNQSITIPNDVDLTDYVKKNEIPKVIYDDANHKLTINGTVVDLPSNVDLSNYYTKSEVDSKITTVAAGGQVDLSDYLTVTNADKTYAKKSEIPTLPDMSQYVKKTEVPAAPDLSPYAKVAQLSDYAKKTDIPASFDWSKITNKPDLVTNAALNTKLTPYATKDDLKTVTSTRHAPTEWTLDRTTNPWTILFDNGCGLQIPDYATMATVYGYGFSANTQNTNLDTYPLIGSIMSASHGALTLDAISKITDHADYWGPNTTVINPIRTDAGDYEWSNVYFNDNSRARKGQYQSDRQKVMLRVMYELGIWSIDDIKPFGLTKKEG